ncbi:MAG: aldo/keto reductase [Planctomycetota bacterium]
MAEMLTRREFLRDGTMAAAAAGLAATAGADEKDEKAAAKAKQTEETKKTRSYNPDMLYRRLGKTGLWVSAVCLGGHWKRIDKVLQNKDDFDKNRAEVASRCLEAGINYVDACMAQEILAYAKALKGKREQVFFGYSWSDREMRLPEWRKADKLMEGLNQGLKESGLEYVDLWRITMLERGSLHTQAEIEEAVKAMEQAKKQGKARCTGCSSHDRNWLKALIEKFPQQLEVILTPYTAGSTVLPKESLFDAVQQQDVGVFGIKPFASNSLFKGDGSPNSPHAEEDSKRARLAIRCILANPAITAPIPGLISAAQVDNMVKAVKEGPGLTEAEAQHLQLACDEMWAGLPEEYRWLRAHRLV